LEEYIMAKIRTRITDKGLISEKVADDVGNSFSVAVQEKENVTSVTTVSTASVGSGDGITLVGAAAMIVLPAIDADNVGRAFTVVNTGSAACTLSASNPVVTPSGTWTTSVAGNSSISTVIALPAASGYFWALRTQA
jgi:DUF917 family protein